MMVGGNIYFNRYTILTKKYMHDFILGFCQPF